jgi:hypothetical protein
MHWGLTANFQFTLLVTALASTCAAGALLACEFFAPRRFATLAPGVMAGVLALVAAVGLALEQSFSLVAGCGSLAALLLVAWLLRHEPAHAVLRQVMQPKAIWAALLGLSLIASRYLAGSVLNSLEQEQPRAEMDLADVPVLVTEAVTDKGRGIALFHFKMHSASEEIQRFIAHS